MKKQVVIHDAVTKHWLHFRNARQLVVIDNIEEVVPALNNIEEIVNKHGLYAAGFISYEASPAFDSALKVRPRSSFPLLWFGLYDKPDIIRLPKNQLINPVIPIHWTPSVEQAEYYKAITQIKEYIAKGDTYQVNYTFRLHAPFSEDSWSLFLRIFQAQQSEYGAYIDTGRFAVCSASPELFFHLNGNKLTARPMKGTAPRGLTLADDKVMAEWLYNSEKNRAENIMIVDMIRNDLGHIAITGSVKVPHLFNVERYPTVWQMTSDVSAESDASVCEIIRALFPCASVTGAPKPHTTEIIAGLETTPRNIYTGCIGFIAPGRRAQFNVAIRTALIDRELMQAEYGVGGGIVWDSLSDEEYKECQVKALVLMETPTEFSLLETILWMPDEKYFLLEYHLNRMYDSAEYFGIPVNIDSVRKKLTKLARSLSDYPHKIRLLISQNGAISCESVRLNDSARKFPVKLRLSSIPVDSSNPFLYHKTTNRKIYDSAIAAAVDCDDVLLWNKRGEITETTIANVVIILDGELITPPVSSGLLPGAYRAWMIDRKKLKEKVIMIDDLKRCEAIYIINSVRKKRKAILMW